MKHKEVKSKPKVYIVTLKLIEPNCNAKTLKALLEQRLIHSFDVKSVRVEVENAR